MVSTTPKQFQKKSFLRSSEGSIASYSWTDIASGLGYYTFYGIKLADGSYGLIDQVISADESATTIDNNGVANTTITYDTSTFNLPKYVKGTAYVNIPICMSTNNSGREIWADITIYHYDGSTETSIGSATTSSTYKLKSTSSGDFEKMQSLAIDLTETQFKKGDLLRIKVAYQMAGASATGQFGHDPEGKTTGQVHNEVGTVQSMIFSDISTTLSLFIPFKLDL